MTRSKMTLSCHIPVVKGHGHDRSLCTADGAIIGESRRLLCLTVILFPHSESAFDDISYTCLFIQMQGCRTNHVNPDPHGSPATSLQPGIWCGFWGVVEGRGVGWWGVPPKQFTVTGPYRRIIVPFWRVQQQTGPCTLQQRSPTWNGLWLDKS